MGMDKGDVEVFVSTVGIFSHVWVRFPVGAGPSHTKDSNNGLFAACMVLMIKEGP